MTDQTQSPGDKYREQGMSNDRELLEKAAKAAGYAVRCVGDGRHGGNVVFYLEPSQLYWNPLVSDSDALRLAADLYLTVAIRPHEVEVFSDDGECLASVPIYRMSMMAFGSKPDTATAVACRAITEAAAKLADSDARGRGSGIRVASNRRSQGSPQERA